MVSDGYQFLEIAGDRKAYLGDFGSRRGWLKQKPSEGLVNSRFVPFKRTLREILADFWIWPLGLLGLEIVRNAN